MINRAESLRSLENLTLPDPRRKEVKIDILQAELAILKLNDNVPEGIAIQFETAKNLFLYSYFVYRFHHIADLQAIATLELSLKTKLDELNIQYRPNCGLAKLLDKAEENLLITTEDIPGYFESATRRAKQRHFYKMIQKMHEENLESLEIDESGIAPAPEDYDIDYLKTTFFNLREIRNIFAHGSTSILFPNLNILILTRSLINTLYKGKP